MSETKTHPALDALRDTLCSLEQHLDEATLAAGLKHRDQLCPCNQNEVRRAKAAIPQLEALLEQRDELLAALVEAQQVVYDEVAPMAGHTIAMAAAHAVKTCQRSIQHDLHRVDTAIAKAKGES